MKALEMAAVAVLILAADGVAGGYQPANDDEVEVFAAALRSEYGTHHWGAEELVCFSVGGKDPSGKLVDALRHRGLRVCSQARWWGDMACGFSVHFRTAKIDPPESARVRVESVDLREFNSGLSCFGTLLRDGEYVLRKTNGAWSILSYTPKRTLQQ
jgi:hypothetical protein